MNNLKNPNFKEYLLGLAFDEDKVLTRLKNKKNL